MRTGTRRQKTIALSLLVAGILLPNRVQAAEGQAVTRWVKRAMEGVRTQNMATPHAGRLYAMVTAAMYDAVNGIDTARRRGREHALVGSNGAPVNGNREVAAAAAAHAVLAALIPDRKELFDSELKSQLAIYSGGKGAAGLAGRRWGEYVGRRVLELRSNDGTQSPLMIPAGNAPGEHRARFDSRWRNMAAFGIATKMAYPHSPPPRLETPEYAAAFNEVKLLGRPDGDLLRDEIAHFWFAESGTVRETGIWFQAAIAISRQHGVIRSLSDTARLFALLGMAIADAVTVSWEVKAANFTWRPAIAIHEADIDGNPSTTADPLWTPRMGSVGGSPEYNSGTSTFAGAASEVLGQFFGNTELAFCFETDGGIGGPRCYESPGQAAEEAGHSRILAGIHFRFSDEDGRRIGQAIGRDIAAMRLRPLSRGRLTIE